MVKEIYIYQENHRTILAQIVVLGAFVKRRKDFILSAKDRDVLSIKMLGRAFSESYRALNLMGIKGGFLLDVDNEYSPADVLINIYAI